MGLQDRRLDRRRSTRRRRLPSRRRIHDQNRVPGQQRLTRHLRPCQRHPHHGLPISGDHLRRQRRLVNKLPATRSVDARSPITSSIRSAGSEARRGSATMLAAATSSAPITLPCSRSLPPRSTRWSHSSAPRRTRTPRHQAQPKPDPHRPTRPDDGPTCAPAAAAPGTGAATSAGMSAAGDDLVPWPCSYGPASSHARRPPVVRGSASQNVIGRNTRPAARRREHRARARAMKVILYGLAGWQRAALLRTVRTSVRRWRCRAQSASWQSRPCCPRLVADQADLDEAGRTRLRVLIHQAIC